MKTGIQISSVGRRETRSKPLWPSALDPRLSPLDQLGPRSSTLVSRPAIAAFTLIEVLVVMVLMSLIVIALMAVFNSTQNAFRASLTQTDVLEGGRSTVGLIKSDLEGMTPSFGRNTNQDINPNHRFWVDNSGKTYVPVNFYVTTNYWQYQSGLAPLVQMLVGSDPNNQRTNVLENFFILTRQNTTWTGVGYVVDTTSTNYFNPLYRFSLSTNVQAADPTVLFNTFLANTALPISTTNLVNLSLSHLMDGVMHLTVRAFDPNGFGMTNNYYNPVSGLEIINMNNNLSFSPSTLGEVGFYMFSNTVPASVEINLGVLEDHALQRAQSLANNPAAQMAYLSNHINQVHVFRQRAWIRNLDPSAYQP